MLLGGSKTDHLFLLDDLKAHLDEIHNDKTHTRVSRDHKPDPVFWGIRPFSRRKHEHAF